MNSEQKIEVWHQVSYSRVLEILNTSSDGLTSTEAAERLKKTGPNILKRQGGETAFKIFLRQFLNPLIYILLASTILAVSRAKILVIFTASESSAALMF